MNVAKNLWQIMVQLVRRYCARCIQKKTFQEQQPRQEKTLLGLYKTAMKAYGPQCMCSGINTCSNALRNFSKKESGLLCFIPCSRGRRIHWPWRCGPNRFLSPRPNRQPRQRPRQRAHPNPVRLRARRRPSQQPKRLQRSSGHFGWLGSLRCHPSVPW